VTKRAEAGDLDHHAAIRHFFLHRQQSYSIAEIAALWRVAPEDVRDIHHDELSRSSNEAAQRISWVDVLDTSVSFSMLRPVDIERALGPDFALARPDAWRTAEVTIHLPRFITVALLSDAAIPPDLSLEVRVEQLILESFMSGLRLAACDEDRCNRQRRV